MKHTISVLVENKPGVLARISGLFSRRGFNIESLAVAPTEREDISRMTIVLDVEPHSLEQVNKQLYKLINVIKTVELKPDESVERELVLFKVYCPASVRAQIVELANIFRAGIVDVAQDTLIMEVTGTESKLKAIADLLRPYGLKEIVRTGKVALARGVKGLE